MAKKKTLTIDFPFYSYLQSFIEQERKKIYSSFTPLSKKFLNFNNPKENTSAFLRTPQFEALEVYVFLKEFCDNKKLFEIFQEWYDRSGIFKGRLYAGVNSKTGIADLFGVIEDDSPADGRETDKATFKKVFDQIKAMEQIYPNYIFALTMGLGKTVLMATTIFYEFLLANKYPRNPRYCHNALVFAPDKTVLQSLREIQIFDKSKVIPAEYLSWLEANLKFHFLDENGDSLNAIENSNFNIIISNTQKIILKRERKAKTPMQELFSSDAGKYYKSLTNKWQRLAEENGDDPIDDDVSLMTNQRFSKLIRLKQLGVYVDEAHHVFGSKLSEDLMTSSKATSLRVTINELAANLAKAGSQVVACYNFTGTPYVGNRLLPEVVYSYGLREAIDNCYLKKTDPLAFANIKDNTLAFCRQSIKDFWTKIGQVRVEGMLPKMAFFASTIDELQNELRPAVEKVLVELNIPISKILVNVGDDKITTNDDLREFKNLDNPASDKQFILLVNKGKEGWNCRSLFSVAMHREPKSTVFVLQAAMRCLRQIGDIQHTALLYLSEENVKILDAELQSNFNMTLDVMTAAGEKSKVAQVRIVPPRVSVKIKKVKKLFNLKNKKLAEQVDFKLREVDLEKYKITISHRDMFDSSEIVGREQDITQLKEKRKFSALTLVAEISRYLNLSPLMIRDILASSAEGLVKLTASVNEYNELLYDEIIPKLFHEIYEIEEFDKADEIEVQLVKDPVEGYYSVKYKNDLLASRESTEFSQWKDKSFNVDNYCFDSVPEYEMFVNLLKDKRLHKVWFTGMLTHGQTEFLINYIDPISGGVRSYYPDFLVQKNDGSYVIIEVKGDNMIDDEVVLAKKAYANQMANASNMEYMIIKGTEARNIIDFEHSGNQGTPKTLFN